MHTMTTPLTRVRPKDIFPSNKITVFESCIEFAKTIENSTLETKCLETSVWRQVTGEKCGDKRLD